jgi:O-antigen chain-terminating methyltransferase
MRRVYLPVAREEILSQQRAEARLVTESARTAAALAGLEIEVEQLREQIRALSSTAATIDAASTESDELYEAFENRFRGSTEEITRRLEPYLADLLALPNGGAPVLDLGCGRGEWLHLLATKGIPAEGIDLNGEFVQRCRDEGLSVRVGDAFVVLESMAADSFGTITAFQLVEHVSIPTVEAMLRHAARVLVPGGLLVVETPNPTNLRVGAASFYRDPTHRRPVHPDLLSFLAEREGFEVGLRYANPMPAPAPPTGDLPNWAREVADELMWALYGPQDYAVLARKPIG